MCDGVTPKVLGGNMSDFDEAALRTQFNQTGKVDRHEAKETIKTQGAREGLWVLGQELNPNTALTYMGSAAVHVYKGASDCYFVSQAAISQDCDKVTVESAIVDLKNNVFEQFGLKPQRKRSGL